MFCVYVASRDDLDKASTFEILTTQVPFTLANRQIRGSQVICGRLHFRSVL